MEIVLKSLCEEIVAILDYQSRIDKIENLELKKLLSHIRDEEKEHVAELFHFWLKNDGVMLNKFQKIGDKND